MDIANYVAKHTSKGGCGVQIVLIVKVKLSFSSEKQKKNFTKLNSLMSIFSTFTFHCLNFELENSILPFLFTHLID